MFLLFGASRFSHQLVNRRHSNPLEILRIKDKRSHSTRGGDKHQYYLGGASMSNVIQAC